MIFWYVDLQLPVQSVPITTKVVGLNLSHGEVYSIQYYMIKFVSLNLSHAEVYSIQYYMIKFVSDLQQVGFPPPIKLAATI